jgi:hypothetical protein
MRLRTTFLSPLPSLTLLIFIPYFLFTISLLGWVCFLVATRTESDNLKCYFVWSSTEVYDYKESCFEFGTTGHALAMITAILAWVQSCVQCHFHRRKKIYPVEMVGAHGVIMLFAGVSLGVKRFGKVLTLRGEDVMGWEYFLALGAGLAGCLQVITSLSIPFQNQFFLVV